MRQAYIDGILVTRPTRGDIENLKVGDLAPDCFGGMCPVVEITAMKEDILGKLFVCYYTLLSETSRISHSMTEDETVPTIPLTSRWKTSDRAPLVGANA